MDDITIRRMSNHILEKLIELFGKKLSAEPEGTDRWFRIKYRMHRYESELEHRKDIADEPRTMYK